LFWDFQSITTASLSVLVSGAVSGYQSDFLLRHNPQQERKKDHKTGLCASETRVIFLMFRAMPLIEFASIPGQTCTGEPVVSVQSYFYLFVLAFRYVLFEKRR
tara:strand:- start:20381 stop:20689 length:309 start_codon:yes stop_codon:yes gene_type:complete